MPFQFTHSWWLLLLPAAWGWILWLGRTSYVSVGPGRRRAATAIRFLVGTVLLLGLAGLQWKRPSEGLNLFYLLDRSDSIPSSQQEAAREYVNQSAKLKRPRDAAGIVVFGTSASIESSAAVKVNAPKIYAVVPTERTDLASAVRLGTAAFPESGQKRLVLFSDGNENLGDAWGAVLAARSLGVTVDVVPLGMTRRGDVSLQKVTVPPTLKKGQTFALKVFAQAEQARAATLRLLRNDQFLGEEKLELAVGKNLFTVPQTLTEPGFYSFELVLDAPGDPVPQNNRASAFTSVRGDPRVLLVSADPELDGPLAEALRSSRLEVKVVEVSGFPESLPELQSYDALFLSNVAAGDLGETLMKLLAGAVRDFGVGLVCVGGDQTYAAGGYRGTPLEETLPVEMELSSKKILPNGAVVLIMHGMEFNNGNQIARECAQGVLDALGLQDELGVVLWDGSDRWLFPLSKVGDKKEKGRLIAGMNQGDLPTFQHVMEMACQGGSDSPGLKQSTANLKHVIVFSDGDPGAPSDELLRRMVNDRITISTVLIAGHAGPERMMHMAEQGGGRFYAVNNPDELPQIFLKEAMVILKSAIFEDPFKPQLAGHGEVLRGISDAELPMLRGYVCTTAKSRAEVPLLSDKGDPVLAHWQYGLGRAVAFTSDAKAKWATDWLRWDKYRQFWAQVAQWTLRRLETADFNADVSVEKGEGLLTVEALDRQGNYRNFLDLRVTVDGPKGDQETARLVQTGPGRYQAHFATRAVGTYLLNLMEMENGRLRAAQALGANVNYSPEFATAEPNLNLLHRLAEAGGGRLLDLAAPHDADRNPFLHDRIRTFQPRDLWEDLLKLAVLLFVLDVGVRRIDIERAEWLKATATLRRLLFFWHGRTRPAETDESLAALLARREQVRSRHADLAAPRAEPTTVAGPPKPLTPGAPGRRQPAEVAVPEPAPPVDRTVTTSRLLEAKRRAARKLESPGSPGAGEANRSE
jgi:uncharacterized membrane protein